MGYGIMRNEQYGTTEISFDRKPSEAIRAELKQRGFRWHGQKKVWYGKEDTTSMRDAIENLMTGGRPEIPESKKINEGTIYEGFEGGNYSTWRSEKELKERLQADFKRHGIKATFRFGRGGYLHRLTTTITIKKSDILSYEEFAKDETRLYRRTWLSYRDEAGDVQHINQAEFFSDRMTPNEYKVLKEKILRFDYDCAVDRLTCSSPDVSVLCGPAREKYETAVKIVTSYNRDDSDIMTDYFDRAIYDRYEFKVID